MSSNHNPSVELIFSVPAGSANMSCDGSGGSVLVLVLGDVRTIPPATVERLEQRRSVGVTRGLRLEEGDPRLLLSGLCDQQREVADRAEVVLVAR